MADGNFYIWASGQPVWVQVLIALVLFFVVLPLVLAVMAFAFSELSNLFTAGSSQPRRAPESQAQDSREALLVGAAIGAVALSSWLAVSLVVAALNDVTLQVVLFLQSPETAQLRLVMGISTLTVAALGLIVVFRFVAPLRRILRGWLKEVGG